MKQKIASPRSEKGGSSKNKLNEMKMMKKKEVELVLTDETIAYISKTLPRYDWVKLAHMLGFLPENIAYFNSQASSAENHYSQCYLMLTTWRTHMTSQSLIPRLCDAFRRMRRHDLAVKFGTDMALGKLEFEANYDVDDVENIPLTTRTNHVQTPRKVKKTKQIDEKRNKKVFPDEKLDDLARKLLGREEWKRFAYALGLLPEDVSHIVGRASSGQNLFAQSRYMLEYWRGKTPCDEIGDKLQQAFIRIRRHDLSHLHQQNRFTCVPPDEGRESPEDKTQRIILQAEEAERKNSVGEKMATHIPDLN